MGITGAFSICQHPTSLTSPLAWEEYWETRPRDMSETWDLHIVQTPGEVQDHIRIISVDSQVSHTVGDDDMTSFRQRVRLKDSESTLSFILWNGCIHWSIKTVHKVTVKQSLNRFSHLSSIYLDAKFPLSFTPQPFHTAIRLYAVPWQQFSQKQPQCLDLWSRINEKYAYCYRGVSLLPCLNINTKISHSTALASI